MVGSGLAEVSLAPLGDKLNALVNSECETKDASTRAEPELLTIWQETMQTPCVAIGGITVEQAPALAKAGADFIAVSAGVWAHPEGPKSAVAAFNAALRLAAAN